VDPPSAPLRCCISTLRDRCPLRQFSGCQQHEDRAAALRTRSKRSHGTTEDSDYHLSEGVIILAASSFCAVFRNPTRGGGSFAWCSMFASDSWSGQVRPSVAEKGKTREWGGQEAPAPSLSSCPTQDCRRRMTARGVMRYAGYAAEPRSARSRGILSDRGRLC
jgi:hypothetical protein